jgi:hypothetical protein
MWDVLFAATLVKELSADLPALQRYHLEALAPAERAVHEAMPAGVDALIDELGGDREEARALVERALEEGRRAAR